MLWCAAVEFMWDSVVESLQQLKDDDASATRGCILAHCMGLGKTLSVCIHPSHWFVELESQYKGINTLSDKSPMLDEERILPPRGAGVPPFRICSFLPGPFSSSSFALCYFPPFPFLIRFTNFLLLPIPSLSTRIVHSIYRPEVVGGDRPWV